MEASVETRQETGERAPDHAEEGDVDGQAQRALEEAAQEEGPDGLVIEQAQPECVEAEVDGEENEPERDDDALPGQLMPVQEIAVDEAAQEGTQREAGEIGAGHENHGSQDIRGRGHQSGSEWAEHGGIDRDGQKAEADADKRGLDREYIGQKNRQRNEYAGKNQSLYVKMAQKNTSNMNARARCHISEMLFSLMQQRDAMAVPQAGRLFVQAATPRPPDTLRTVTYSARSYKFISCFREKYSD